MKYLLLYLFFCAVLLLPGASFGSPIYVYELPDGSKKFSTKPPPSGVRAKVFTAKNAKYSTYRSIRGPRVQRLYPNRYREHIEQASVKHGVSEALIRSVIHAESSFNPYAVSRKGAQGLMQLMPYTAREMRVNNSFSPAENIMGGTRYLSWLLKKYKGNLKLALAAYNAGPEAVAKYSGVPPYRETQQYVAKVLRLHKKYQNGTGKQQS